MAPCVFCRMPVKVSLLALTNERIILLSAFHDAR